MKTVYVVFEGHTLGYFQNRDTIPTELSFMGVLAGSVRLGGRDPKNGVTMYDPATDTVRLATKDDFDFFRVCSKGHIE
ncbi:hypothetical protein PHIN3_6 [Sinorhizobium phage phiN3]|uniref:Uncharacterized protein n=1 Tax=Sinorhizobium phage phiN3 TaxID=1647405 RepID=A0A0F6SIY7_9CAUD|nr:hypothetical protein AVT40_gp006 [Sinorhizobium phage phiN3]AKF13273.1 hypothetical protein PHIN3_6 [Sinorhizobium phage phiN3]